MVSITNVVVAGDLQHCKVSVSILAARASKTRPWRACARRPYLRGGSAGA